jgi:cytochrome c oxidase cbb3-type subunit 1
MAQANIGMPSAPAASVPAGAIRGGDDLVNTDLVRAWLWWALVWLTIFPLVGLLVSIKFDYPDFLGGVAWLTFGRLRPVHVNGVIFGAFSTPVLGLLYYLVPRLCGRRMSGEKLGWPMLWAWNVFLVTGSVSLLMGYNLGFEAGEYQWPFNLLRWLILAVIAGQVIVTIFRRTERGFYVALWYVLAGLVWTTMNLVLGGVVLPYVPMSGISNTALHGLYIHYVVGLWITPAGLCLMYFFMPLATKQPLFSHRLSLLGFWSLAFFYPFVGTHHYIFSPIPYHSQTLSIVASMMLIVPVWAVVTNMFGTAWGRFRAIFTGTSGDDIAARFLILATGFYLVGCFQGSTEALRGLQELTHFTDFVISHSHFTVFATFVLAAVGSLYYVWPRVTGRHLWSPLLARWHVWLTIVGTLIMLFGLALQGIIQGHMLETGANFVDSMVEMKPWWFVRTLAGATMDIGFVLLTINMVMTARKGAVFVADPDTALIGPTPTRPAALEVVWYTRPSSIFVIAGISFFVLAVLIQGILPSILPQTYDPTVVSAETGQLIRVRDYTPLERAGRLVYIRDGCWYCHSQFVRPVTGEDQRWGPVSQAGEYVYDQPHMLSTRRIGPDLTREGGRYEDQWHIAHHWNPRDITPDSIMPSFPWLFKEPTGKGPPEMNADGLALVAYVQRLGTGIGDWRETFVSTRFPDGAKLPITTPEQRAALVPQGKAVYERRCIGCHGVKGDGEGPSARFLNPKPRNFTTGIFKFRSTTGGPFSLPSDDDLFVTISHGLWGTAMPPWYEISADERIAVIQYIKTFSDKWKTEAAGAPLVIPEEPAVTPASIANGKAQFESVGCVVCHGAAGRGDGVTAAFLQDGWQQPIKPANFTLPAGTSGGVKLGHDSRHLFITISTGIGGGPMPPFVDVLSPAQRWDIVHYVQSLRVEAHVAELRAVGLTEPTKTASICTSSIPWLLAACQRVVMPIVEFCSLGGAVPPLEGNARFQLSEARQRIWASLSEAASHHGIDPDVLRPLELPVAVDASPDPSAPTPKKEKAP